MKICGEKLQMARLLAGYTVTELAEKIGVSKQSLSQYENGVEPKIDVYFKLLKVLNCKKEFLEIPIRNKITTKNNFFRAMAAATATERKNQAIKTELVIHTYSVLSQFLELPEINLPNLDNFDSIEQKAEALRKYWGINNEPVNNMVNLLERNGIVVSTFNASNNLNYKIDGYTQQFSIKDFNFENRFCVIVENNKDSLARKNFSLAHELGHIILHSDDNYVEKTKSEQNAIERQANQFASAFLLPSKDFYYDVRNISYLNDFIWLKRKWNVSIGAMMMRARELDCISSEKYLKFVKIYSYRGYRKKEPLDDEVGTYKPTLFKKSLELLFENGMSVENFEKEMESRGLALPLDTIEEVLGLDVGFFSKYQSKNDCIIINFKNKS